MGVFGKNNLLVLWVYWQFYEVPAFLVTVWGNYLRFAENYFSVLFLLKTLFAPWHRYNWQYPKAFDLYEFSLAFTSNVFSRFLGAVMRLVLITAGIGFWMALAIAGAVALAAWYLVPFVVAVCIFIVFAA